ncbi:MAG TPA: hypothetical protein VMD03_05225 [Steroidobacteraceae bacterium]|nr:hypothetical protein [Steroidobacteraceae bacterium]
MPYSAHRRFSARSVLLTALLVTAPSAAFTATTTAAQATPGGAPAAATDSTSATGVPQPARWTQKKLFFVYMGLQTRYGCQGLTDDVRQVLLELGARKSDLNVQEAGCTSGFNQPTPHPAVAGTFSVLEPVPPERAYSPSATPGTVAARWQAVQVQLARPGRDVNGQCELLDQVRRRILPLFTTRNVQYQSTCSPRQLIVGGTSLRLEVLVPDTGNPAGRQ